MGQCDRCPDTGSLYVWHTDGDGCHHPQARILSRQRHRPGLSSHLFSATTSPCAAIRRPRRNSSRRTPHSATWSSNAPISSKPSITLSIRVQLAARSTHILSLVRSNRSSGPFSCTNTLIITYGSSTSDGVIQPPAKTGDWITPPRRRSPRAVP